MAQPASEAREALIGLTAITQDELRTVLEELRRMGLSADQARDALLDLLPGLAGEYHMAASALAADWFDDVREAAEVRGVFVAEPVPPPESARWEALVRWGVDPLYAAEPDWVTTFTKLVGGLQRGVADGHRLTVVENSRRDPQAAGWRRVGVGDNCGFCRMLIDRGAVYTDDTATFRSHDHCNCAASPAYDDRVVKVSREPYRQSLQRPRTDEALRRRNQAAYNYIAKQYGDN